MDKEVYHTLLDINQRLKRKNEKRRLKNRFVFRVWTKEKGKQLFLSEASTLNFFRNKWPRNRCPFCGSVFGNKNIVHKNDKSWTFICPDCKSTLTVLNE